MYNSLINDKYEDMLYGTELSSSSCNTSFFNNIIDMSYMFSNCRSLSSLPDISKWNTNNVTDMS